MKKCIWCLLEEPDTSFNKRAHIIPQSLGAKKITKFECDSCNEYFGNAQKGQMSVEHAFKEVFNITRIRILNSTSNQPPKFRSTYFNFSQAGLRLKPQFKLKRDFQAILCKQFKKGPVFKS